MNVPSAEFSEGKALILELTAFLHELGLALVSLRELVRQTGVAYSFIDTTPGNVSDSVCLHVNVDVTRKLPNTSWVGLDELLTRLQAAPFGSKAVEIAIAKLILERNI